MPAGDNAFWSDVARALDPPMGRLLQTTVQSGIASAAATAATFGAGSEDLDTHGFHDTAVNTSRVTPNVAGWYRVNGGVALAGATDYTSIEVRVRKNGATNLAPATKYSSGAGSLTQVAVASALVSCNGSGDYFELVFQANKTAGTVATVISSQYTTVLEWEYVRPL